LLKPPALWVTLQALLLLGILLWHYLPRFGQARPLPPPSRRSKEEFLNALASLLERKGDRTAAYSVAADILAREMAEELGLPPGTPSEALAQEAARHRRVDPVRLQRVLSGQGLPATDFVQALDELETKRGEFFRG